jgi:hypothetical protein
LVYKKVIKMDWLVLLLKKFSYYEWYYGCFKIFSIWHYWIFW